MTRQGNKRSTNTVAKNLFVWNVFCFHPICISFNHAMLRILEQIKHETRIVRKRFLNKQGITQVCGKRRFNDSPFCFIFSQYYNYCEILSERLKNYQITHTVLLAAATIVYWKNNALPTGNWPEIMATVLLCTTLKPNGKFFGNFVWLHMGLANSEKELNTSHGWQVTLSP